jgi:hypothetical protein
VRLIIDLHELFQVTRFFREKAAQDASALIVRMLPENP